MRKYRVGWVRPISGGFRREFQPMTEPMECAPDADPIKADAKVYDELRVRGYWDMITKLPRRGYSVLVLDEGETPWVRVNR